MVTTQIISCVLILVGLLFIPATIIAGQAGPPDGLDVTIVNPLPLPVQVVEDEMPITFQRKMAIVRDPGSDCEEPCVTPFSPTPKTGKILTIEFISGYCRVDKDAEVFRPGVITSFQGEEFIHLLTYNLADLLETTMRSRKYITSQKTKIFADTNNPIEPYFETLGGEPEPSVWCGVAPIKPDTVIELNKT